MKKIILTAALAIAAIGGYQINKINSITDLSEMTKANIEALADVNPLCPNGCVANGDGCMCYGWFQTYKEYD